MEAPAQSVVAAMVAAIEEQRDVELATLRARETTLDEQVRRNRRHAVARYRAERRRLEVV